VRLILQAFAPALANAPNEQAARQILDQILTYVQQSKLPRRRANVLPIPGKWNRGRHFPVHTK
jgi:hypothetical protein